MHFDDRLLLYRASFDELSDDVIQYIAHIKHATLKQFDNCLYKKEISEGKIFFKIDKSYVIHFIPLKICHGNVAIFEMLGQFKNFLFTES